VQKRCGEEDGAGESGPGAPGHGRDCGWRVSTAMAWFNPVFLSPATALGFQWHLIMPCLLG
jgi:hypothetical protein